MLVLDQQEYFLSISSDHTHQVLHRYNPGFSSTESFGEYAVDNGSPYQFEAERPHSEAEFCLQSKSKKVELGHCTRLGECMHDTRVKLGYPPDPRS